METTRLKYACWLPPRDGGHGPAVRTPKRLVFPAKRAPSLPVIGPKRKSRQTRYDVDFFVQRRSTTRSKRPTALLSLSSATRGTPRRRIGSAGTTPMHRDRWDPRRDSKTTSVLGNRKVTTGSTSSLRFPIGTTMGSLGTS